MRGASQPNQPERSDDLVAGALVRSEVLFFVPDAPVRFASGILSPVYMDVRRLLAHPAQWSEVIRALVKEAGQAITDAAAPPASSLSSAALLKEAGQAITDAAAPPASSLSPAAQVKEAGQAITDAEVAAGIAVGGIPHGLAPGETGEPTLVVAGVAVGGIPHSSAVAVSAGLPSCFVRAQAKSHGRAKAVEGAEVDGRKVVLIEDVITTGGSSLEAVETLRRAGGEVAACIAITGYGFPEAAQRFEKAGVPLRLLTTFGRVLEAAERAGSGDAAAVKEARRWHADPRNWSPPPPQSLNQ